MTEKKTALKAPKGVPDYVPPTSAGFVSVRDAVTSAARRAGYGHIELPIFEDTTLFARGVGESTDVVEDTTLFARGSGSRPTWSPRRCTPSPTGVAAA